MNDRLIHGGDIRGYRERFPGIEPVDFSANINPLGMPYNVREAYYDSLDGCMRYPDYSYRDLKTALSGFENVDAGNIACAGGACDIIYRIACALGPKKVLIPSPVFAEYERAHQMAGCEIIHHELSPATDFDLDESVLPLISKADVLYLCHPCNPTGRLIDDELMVKIASACEESGTLLIADECFLDFAADGEYRSFKRFLPMMGGIIVIKAFTKIFAMPGLRLGYALTGCEELAEIIQRAGPPWSVSLPACDCALAAVNEHEYLNKTRIFIREQRERIQNELEDLGFHVCESSANFILFYSRDLSLAARLLENGFILRDCSGFRGLSGGWLRTAVRKESENSVLLKAIKELM